MFTEKHFGALLYWIVADDPPTMQTSRDHGNGAWVLVQRGRNVDVTDLAATCKNFHDLFARLGDRIYSSVGTQFFYSDVNSTAREYSFRVVDRSVTVWWFSERTDLLVKKWSAMRQEYIFKWVSNRLLPTPMAYELFGTTVNARDFIRKYAPSVSRPK